VSWRRLTLFLVALALIGGAAALAGRASGVDVGAQPEPAEHAADAAPAQGLSDAAAGLRLRIEPGTLAAGRSTPLAVSLRDEEGSPVTELDEHGDEPPLHLVLVRRDLSEYLHLHPRREGDDFVVEARLPDPGAWRAYADFELDGDKIVLGRDLLVPGTYAPAPLPHPTRTAASGAYRVALDRAELVAGEEATLAFRVERDGAAVADFEPYLGADGHLVAIRADDLSYLHVHPVERRAGDPLAFGAELSAPGRYALFLQFRHDGAVRTTRFTVDVG
jgi:hypothetical protein